MSKVVVFTGVTGNFRDRVMPPLGQVLRDDRRQVRFVCFSDTLTCSEVPAPYELRLPLWEHDDPRRTARWHKLNAHLLFPDADFTLWHDGSHQLVGDPWDMIERTLGSQADFAAFRHPDRDCVYQELDACIRLRKDDPELMRNQVARYRLSGYPPGNGLFETTAVLRRTCSEIAHFNSRWWEELRDGSTRDQLSVNYVTTLCYTRTAYLDGHRTRSPWFNFRPHR